MRYGGSLRGEVDLPLDVDYCFQPSVDAHLSTTGRRETFQMYPPPVELLFDTFSRMHHLLINKSSIFDSQTTEAAEFNSLDALFGHGSDSVDSTSFRMILPRLLAISAWQTNIQTLDRHLQALSSRAMSKPSLDAFRPIPVLRKYVADLRFAIRDAQAEVRGAEMAVFAKFQEATEHRLESLDRIFESLLRQSDALSAAAGNEIQLVIGSVTIQVSSPIDLSYNCGPDLACRTRT